LGEYKKISITMPAVVLELLDEWAAELGMSRSEAIRHAIRVAMEKRKRR